MTSSDSEVDAVYMEEVEETPGAENEFSELTGGSSNVPKGERKGGAMSIQLLAM